jgi:hypothetical protein
MPLLAALAFTLTLNGRAWPHEIAFVTVMPGAPVRVEAAGGPSGDFRLKTESGTAVQHAARRWTWTAPDRPGTYTFTVKGPSHDVDVHAFVMVPAVRASRGVLNGYRIGQYPPARGRYQPPAGFIELTRENEDTKLSPHFRLKQFLCKQEPIGQYPKYLIVEPALVLNLERALERVKRLGFDVDTLHVMSGYRTPFYNAQLRDVPYSMHQWGGAADVYVDTKGNDRMADLNRDGEVGIDDAKYLLDELDPILPPGGLGYYPSTAAHPPFVHVDARGTKARWRG